MNKLYKDLSGSDRFELGTARTITPEGFLEAPATIARAGVQLYRARELGLDKYGMAPDNIVRLHRPTEELFRPETMGGFDGKPVINTSHKPINATNWKDEVVGDVSGPQAHGMLLNVNRLSVKDKDAIDDVNSGKKYLSIGYKFDLDMTPGTTATGDAYDGIQRNIIPNHVLITDSPRGGPVCAIADSASVNNKEKKMRKINVNGVPVEVGDSEASIIESLIAERDAARNQPAKITYLGQPVTGDAIVTLLETKDKEIKTLKDSTLTEAQVEERVNARASIVGDAAAVVKDFDSNGKTNKQIQQEILTKVTGEDSVAKSLIEAILGGKSIADAGDEQIGAAFRAIAASKKQAASTSNGTQHNAGDSALATALTAGQHQEVKVVGDQSKLSGRDAFIARSNAAWRGESK